MDETPWTPKRYSLEDLKAHPEKQEELRGTWVRIWSQQWRAYWRDSGQGYSDQAEGAGVFSFLDAFNRSSHAGPEKEVFYEPESVIGPCERDERLLIEYLQWSRPGVDKKTILKLVSKIITARDRQLDALAEEKQP